jgi:hypothetical protein
MDLRSWYSYLQRIYDQRLLGIQWEESKQKKAISDILMCLKSNSCGPLKMVGGLWWLNHCQSPSKHFRGRGMILPMAASSSVGTLICRGRGLIPLIRPLTLITNLASHQTNSEIFTSLNLSENVQKCMLLEG